jgi:MOSC domain-containing protein YiiM
MRAEILSVNAGSIRPVPWGELRRSAIDKRPVAGRVRAGRLGLALDEQADRANHGGVDQALYAYAREDLDWWEGELGRPLAAGLFGENLTTRGLDVNGALVGERWALGEVLLEVSAPRIPCSVFEGVLREEGWVKRLTQAARPGAYLRVVAEGPLGAGDGVEVVARPAHGVSVADVFRAVSGERALVPRVLEAPELPARLQEWLRRLLAGRT